MTCIIVDDEPHARALVREFLEDHDHVEVAGECGNGREAIEMIHETEPDLVFLDVQMPGLDGFDVLERLEAVPFVIFSTAYDEYALSAFEAGAVDYLCKPYSRDRFRTAVERVTERVRQAREAFPEETASAMEEDGDADEAPAAYVDEIASLLDKVRSAELDASDEPGEGAPEQLYVRHGKKIVPVPVADIQWIEAAGDYAKLHTASDTHLASSGLGELADRLPDDRFQRLHRSHVVALSAIDHLRSDGSGGYEVHLTDGTRLRVSRTYAPEIRKRIV